MSDHLVFGLEGLEQSGEEVAVLGDSQEEFLPQELVLPQSVVVLTGGDEGLEGKVEIGNGLKVDEFEDAQSLAELN